MLAKTKGKMKQKRARRIYRVACRAREFADALAMQYWHKNPFGEKPRANREEYQKLWEKARAQNFPDIDAFEKEAGFAVDPDWLHELALHTQIVIKKSELCYQHGRILYSALRRFLAGHDREKLTILETGTARGFSAVVMTKALADARKHGTIITFDLLPHDTPIYWNCIDDLDGMKSRRQLLAPWNDLIEPTVVFIENDSRIGLRRLGLGHIDFAFLDGAHTYSDVMLEFNCVQRRQRKDDVIVFDDYSPTIFAGLVKAVDEGSEQWGYTKKILRSEGERAYVIAQKKS